MLGKLRKLEEGRFANGLNRACCYQLVSQDKEGANLRPEYRSSKGQKGEDDATANAPAKGRMWSRGAVGGGGAFPKVPIYIPKSGRRVAQCTILSVFPRDG